MPERKPFRSLMLATALGLSQFAVGCSGSKELTVESNTPFIVDDGGNLSTLTPPPDFDATGTVFAELADHRDQTSEALMQAVLTIGAPLLEQTPTAPSQSPAPEPIPTNPPIAEQPAVPTPPQEPASSIPQSEIPANGINVDRLMNAPLDAISSEALETVRRSTTMLIVQAGDRQGQCTGVHIGGGTIVSAGHCAIGDPSTQYHVGHPAWRWYSAQLSNAVFRGFRDAGVWQIEGFENDLGVAPLQAVSNLKSGDTVFSLSYSLHGDGSTSIRQVRGKFITSAQDETGQPLMIYADGIDGMLRPGDSGAFIFDHNGSWIGDVTRSASGNQEGVASVKANLGISNLDIPNISLGLPAISIRAFLGR